MNKNSPLKVSLLLNSFFSATCMIIPHTIFCNNNCSYDSVIIQRIDITENISKSKCSWIKESKCK